MWEGGGVGSLEPRDPIGTGFPGKGGLNQQDAGETKDYCIIWWSLPMSSHNQVKMDLKLREVSTWNHKHETLKPGSKITI